jgi:glycosyltransferase involved in cell wall biosynthesis
MYQLKLWYEIQNYQSHRRVASVYRHMLSQRYIFAKRIDEADVVILHVEPRNYRLVFDNLASLKTKYVISYCVWEASELPVAYQQSLALVQEVWTCSAYCVEVIKKYHPRVFRIPHTMERDQSSHALDEVIIRRLICFDPHYYYVLAIASSCILRKNLKGLVNAFEAVSSAMPDARLIIKGAIEDPIFQSQNPRILYLPMTLSESQINVLYKVADVYVSAHHSEGWGLTLSDAILFGKPVVATGYSGNLEFMDDNNSFLIRFTESDIRDDEVYGLFTTQMKWADPDLNHLEDILISLYSGRRGSEAVEKSKYALEDSKKYSNDSVKNMLFERMESIQQELSV